jgi:hypothetical protein
MSKTFSDQLKEWQENEKNVHKQDCESKHKDCKTCQIEGCVWNELKKSEVKK